MWSFGVLMWEIVTLGSTPYPGMAGSEVMKRVREGHRLEKPEHCDREIFNMMFYCWDKDPEERPSFTSLVKVGTTLELQTNLRKDFTIVEKAFSWLKAHASTFTFKTLLRHYAKQAPKHCK